jgi:glyoxylase-like metal-dependent hydrolase (beta-lactamase superfamily II)
VQEIAPGIHALGDESRGWVRAFLVDGGDGLTLIDSLSEEHPFTVLAAIRKLSRPISDLKRIWVTHAHYSHLVGLAALKELSGARVGAHEWEVDIIEGEREAQRVPILPKPPIRAYIPFQLGLALGKGKHPPCKVDDVLRDGHKDGGLTVYHTPGHTPGHLAFWSNEHHVLFAGDAIVTWPYLSAGWDSFSLNEEERWDSLRTMASLEPKAVGVGHGKPITSDVAEKLSYLVDVAPPTTTPTRVPAHRRPLLLQRHFPFARRGRARDG